MDVIEIQIHAGGYWAEDRNYVGGDTHLIRGEEETLKMKDLQSMVLAEGYTSAMDSFWYFPSGVSGEERKNLAEDSDVEEMLSSLVGIKNVYVVRSDDPNFEGFKSRVGDRSESESEGDEDDSAFHLDNKDIDQHNIAFHEGQVFLSKDSFNLC